jgi:uncharacterized membrane protein
MLLQMADRLQENSLIIALTSTGWTAAGLAILHYYSMFVLVGSMAIVDLRLLGVMARDQSAAGLVQRIFPWVWGSLAVNLVSGFIMFAGDATAYVPTRSFHVKVLVVLLAIMLGIIVQWKVPTWDRSPALPRAAKFLAAVSLLFWIGAILMGVEVPAISGIG